MLGYNCRSTKTKDICSNSLFAFCFLVNNGSHIRTFPYASYEEIRNAGMFSSDANCSQFLLDMKILPTHRQCRGCQNPMAIGSCSTTKYREGCCWKCPCGQTTSLRANSVLENKNISYREFIDILGQFSEGNSISHAAQQVNVSETTVRRVYRKVYRRV